MSCIQGLSSILECDFILVMALSLGLISLLLLFNLAIGVITDVYYIKPTIEYQCSIHNQPCLTLEDFIMNTSRRLIANTISSLELNAELSSLELSVELLPGNHTLNRHLQVWSISKFQVSSQINSSWIICHEPNKEFQFFNVTTIDIRNLNFFGCGGCKSLRIDKFTAKNCVFLQSDFSHATFGVILATNSTIEISHCSFIGTYHGSVIYLSHSELSSSHSIYRNNTASIIVLEKESIAVFDSCIFQNNSAVQFALVISNASIIVIQDNLWEHNGFQTQDHDPNRKFEFMFFCFGSAIILRDTTVENNIQTYAAMGGILMATYSDISLYNCTFKWNFGQNFIFWIAFSNTYVINTTMLLNRAAKGELFGLADGNVTEFQELNVTENSGNFRLFRSEMIFSGKIIYFNNNGSIVAFNSLLNFYGDNHFLRCRHNLSIDNGGIVSSDRSTVHFYGTTYFLENQSPNKGGAIFAINSKLYMHYKVIIAYNVANVSGGGIYLFRSNFYCLFNCTLFHNCAVVKGGGIHAVSSKIIADVEFLTDSQKRYILFSKNKARLGGAVNLEQNSKLSLVDSGLNTILKVEFEENMADYGGAMHISNESQIFCNSRYFAKHTEQTECFLLAYKVDEANKKLITFSENLANIAGSAIFGGFLDRCTVNPRFTDSEDLNSGMQQPAYGLSFLLGLSNLQPAEIASHPVQVCYCYNYTYLNQCTYNISSKVLQRGEKLPLSVVVVDQAYNTINATLFSVVSSVRGVDRRQYHHIYNVCTNLSIRVFPESNQLDLYAISPCNNTAISRRVIKISISECNCPIGFSASDNIDACECICDPKLPSVIKKCKTQTSSIIREGNFWIGHINSTITTGYLLYPNCPFDYCRPATPPVSINFNTLTGTDAQCAAHRTGLLCGQCQAGFSLSFGGTACISCPKSWPGLLTANLIVQILTGIIIIGLMLVLNLTVAAGTFNGLIFYANIVARNKYTFLPFMKTNMPTMFIEWLNLQLGIERCHFNGMNAYTKAWIQLTFPTYMFLLVILVIFISRRSLLFTRLIARGNPVAVLATAILLSYTTILRNVIDIFSFAILRYPDGSRHVIWLPDTSISYLKGKHVLLFLAAVIIVAIGIAYTALLFSWQWLLKAPQIKAFALIRDTRLNSFMDAYLAPHTLKSRYWTGLLLFIRVVIFILSAVNVSGDPSFNLLVISVAVVILLLLQLYSRSRIYKNVLLDCFEMTSYFNLLFLSLATSYTLSTKRGQETAAYISISVAFVMFLCALLYHILLRIYQIQCLKRAKQFLRQKLYKRSRRSNDLSVNLLENSEMNDHPADVPTATVVGMSPQHSSTASEEEDIN